MEKREERVLCRHMTSYGECTLTEEPCVQGPCSREEPEEWAPVVHGQWRYSGPLLECQSCGEIYSRLGGNAGKLWNYCPNCGAKMDGDGNG